MGYQLKDSHQNNTLGAEMLAGPTVPVAPLLPTWRLTVAPSLCSMSLASTAPPALTASPSHVQCLFYTSGLPQLLPRIFLKSLKGLQMPDKQGLAMACPIQLAKWLLAQPAPSLNLHCLGRHKLWPVLAWKVASAES